DAKPPAPAKLLIEDADHLRHELRVSEPLRLRAGRRQVKAPDHAEPDVRRTARLEKARLGVGAQVANALATEVELHVVVGRVRADSVRTAVTAHDHERYRQPELELGRAGLEPERADDRRRHHVLDLVTGHARSAVASVRITEAKHLVAPVERTQAEGHFLVS